MFGRPTKRPVVISASDVQAALSHLNALPYTVTKGMPMNWGQKQVIDWIAQAMPRTLQLGQSFEVGTGIWAHIKPLGYEFSGYSDPAHKLQIVLSIRSVNTDLNRLTTLE